MVDFIPPTLATFNHINIMLKAILLEVNMFYHFRVLMCLALLLTTYCNPIYASDDDLDIDIEYTLEDPLPLDEETINEETLVEEYEEPILEASEEQITEEDIINGNICDYSSYLGRIINKAPGHPYDQTLFDKKNADRTKWLDDVFFPMYGIHKNKN